MKFEINNAPKAYAALWFVVLIWGTAPLLNNYMVQNFSPSVALFGHSLLSFLTLLLFNIKTLKELDKKCVRIAVLTGVFNMLATLLQSIGLLYTSPANYAFLENLSCVVVPFALWILVRKKPTALNIVTVVLCLVGAFILASKDMKGFSFSVGDILCGAAGLLYGINIALTGVYAKDVKPGLFIMIQMLTTTVLSFGSIFLLNGMRVNGEPIVGIWYNFSLLPLLVIGIYAVVVLAFCWTIRTKAIQIVNPTAVAVIMPTAAVVTSIISVITGTDALTWQLCVGGTIGFSAALLASFDELPCKKLHAGAGK